MSTRCYKCSGISFFSLTEAVLSRPAYQQEINKTHFFCHDVGNQVHFLKLLPRLEAVAGVLSDIVVDMEMKTCIISSVG